MNKAIIAPLIYPYSNSYNNAKQGKYYFPALSQSSSATITPYANGAMGCALITNQGSEQGKLLFVPSVATINSCTTATYNSIDAGQMRKFLTSLDIPLKENVQNAMYNNSFAFGIKWIDDVNNTGKKIYYVDWADQYVYGYEPWTYVNYFDFSTTSIFPVMSGQEISIEESSGSIETPSDDPYVNVEKAIYTAAAVPICLCFFFVIYKMFMRLRG